MSVAIRLSRTGRKNEPSYRIVVADKSKKRDGKFIAIIGHYNPMADSKKIIVHAEKLKNWLSKGAKLSESLQKLLKNK